jgi:predicted transposase YbfD/YdcC
MTRKAQRSFGASLLKIAFRRKHMNPLLLAAAAIAMTVLDLRNDARIREEKYTRPLSTMPENVKALIKEMTEAASKEKGITQEQLTQIEAEIYQMMSEGAVAQRNFEMEKTRDEISAVGYFISSFMKQKGVSYAQIKAKYEKEFSESEKLGHLKIIESASRSNKNLVDKFCQTIQKKLGLTPVPVQAKL